MKKRLVHWNTDLKVFEEPDHTLVIQAPLPDFGTWPRLHSIKGRRNGRQGPSPLAPREEAANE